MTEPAWPEQTARDDTDEDMLRRLNPWRVATPPPGQPGLNGPDCIWCNCPTQRAGNCFVCPACGASTSC